MEKQRPNGWNSRLRLEHLRVEVERAVAVRQEGDSTPVRRPGGERVADRWRDRLNGADPSAAAT